MPPILPDRSLLYPYSRRSQLGFSSSRQIHGMRDERTTSSEKSTPVQDLCSVGGNPPGRSRLGVPSLLSAPARARQGDRHPEPVLGGHSREWLTRQRPHCARCPKNQRANKKRRQARSDSFRSQPARIASMPRRGMKAGDRRGPIPSILRMGIACALFGPCFPHSLWQCRCHRERG